MNRLKAAVVGLGNIGIMYDLPLWNDKNRILTHTKAYLTHKGFELKFGIDEDKTKRDIFSRYAGKPAYKDLTELESGNMDIVSICVPTELHLKAIKDVTVRIRTKYILCEKPIADNMGDYREIISICEKRNIGLAVNYVRRWDSAVIKLRQMLRKKYFGRIRAVHCYYTKGLLNNASHFIDLLHYWFSEEDRVSIINVKKSMLERDVDVSFVMHYKDFEAVFQCGDGSDYGLFEVDIIAEKGRIKYNNSGSSVGFYKKITDKMFRDNKMIGDTFYEIKNNMNCYQYYVMDGIYDSIRHRKKLLSDGVSADKTMKTCFEVKRLCKNLR